MTDLDEHGPADNETDKPAKKAKSKKKGESGGKQAAPAAGTLDNPAKKSKAKMTNTTEIILIRHALTDKELADLGTQSGRLQGEVTNLEATLGAIKKDYTSQIEMKNTTISSLGVKLANGYEMRETKALVIYDAKAGTKKFVNPKNKREVYREADMTEADRQLPMFQPEVLAATKKKPEAKAAEKKAKGAKEIPPLDDLSKEAALASEKVDLHLDMAIQEGMMPDKLILNFGRQAKKSGWANPVIKAVKAHAEAHAEEGISEVADALRPFCIEK